MSEPKFDLTRDESDRDVERRSRPSVIPEDHLQTTRLPGITPPPIGFSSAPPSSGPPGFTSSPASAVVAVAPRLPSFDAEPGESVSPPSSTTDAPAAKPSWWRNLLTATFPPPRPEALSADERALRRRAGSGAAIFALTLLVASLVIGLRAAPAAEPTVAAVVVASRAALALGLLGLVLALLRAAERLFFVPAEGADVARARDGNRPAPPIN
jgi:hypothetical protein